jgi:hypothetical protein
MAKFHIRVRDKATIVHVFKFWFLDGKDEDSELHDSNCSLNLIWSKLLIEFLFLSYLFVHLTN